MPLIKHTYGPIALFSPVTIVPLHRTGNKKDLPAVKAVLFLINQIWKQNGGNYEMVENAKSITIQNERKKLKRELTVLPLFGLLYFTVCGGAFGSESMVGESGPGMALIMLALTPLFYSLPSIFMVREMSSMMPVEGGFYHWVKQAFGPLPGFIVAWMNLLTSWLDSSIYPVLAANYIGFFIPVFRQGFEINGVEISGKVISYLFGISLIWLITYLQIRGARLTGVTTDWIGLIMIIPLIIMSIFGIVNWIRSDVPISIPLLPENQTLVGAFSLGLFVAMWNFMGWELPSSAGDEIARPHRTYPIAMVLTLLATIATYSLPMTAGIFGGAGTNGQDKVWGVEEESTGEGIGSILEERGITSEQASSWGLDQKSSVGFQYPDIARIIGEKFSGKGSFWPGFLGAIVTISALLSMVGLFIGNSLGTGRLPYALAQDGMMPLWLVKTHPKYGTPWVAILIGGFVYSIFALGTFSVLVVIDVAMDALALLLQFAAMWKLRFSKPNIPRKKVPGGWVGITIITLCPTAIVLLAIVSQISEEGWRSMSLTALMILIGVGIYFPCRKWIKPGVPDVDPFTAPPAAEED